jgi:hypothetical protein
VVKWVELVFGSLFIPDFWYILLFSIVQLLGERLISLNPSILANQNPLFCPSNPNLLGNRGVTYDLRTGVQADASTLFTKV